jgi:hypothetical protein
MRTVAWLSLSTLLAVPAPAAPAVRSWLQVHADFDQVGHGLVLFDDDAAIRADGSIQARLSTYRSSNQLMPYWTTEFGSANAAAGAVAALRETLGAVEVGLLAGGCAVERQVVGPGSVRIAWFGRGARRNTIEVAMGDASLPACGDEIKTLIEALARFLGDSGLALRGLGGLR